MGNGFTGTEQRVGISAMLLITVYGFVVLSGLVLTFPLDSVSGPFDQLGLPVKPIFSIF